MRKVAQLQGDWATSMHAICSKQSSSGPAALRNDRSVTFMTICPPPVKASSQMMQFTCRRYVRNNLLKADQQRCAMTTVSSLMTQHSLERIDLLKIDVEGAELDVLHGIHPEDWPRIHQVSATAVTPWHILDSAHALVPTANFPEQLTKHLLFSCCTSEQEVSPAPTAAYRFQPSVAAFCNYCCVRPLLLFPTSIIFKQMAP